MSIDISVLNRDALFQALWLKAKPLQFYPNYRMTPNVFDLELAKKEINSDGYCNIILCRKIGANIYNTNFIDPTVYDINNGNGSFAKVVAELKNE